MSNSAKAEAVLALHRFGMGPRPGSIAAVGTDPRGALIAELDRPLALAAAATLPSSAKAFRTVADANARRTARAKQAQQQAKKQQMAAVPAMAEDQTQAQAQTQIQGQAQGQSEAKDAAEMAAKKAAEAIPDPGRPIYLQEAKLRTEAALAADIGFAERLVWFWSNHFCVSANKIQSMSGAYEREVIRANAFGRFVDMLQAAEGHPAMLFYLDNLESMGANSTAGINRSRGLNENFAREIVELHTLGVRTGYTQDDVISFANILTGWTLVPPGADPQHGGEFTFNPRLHEPGGQTVLGKRYEQEDVEQGRAVLRDLAAHPATATHVATKLARHFVADEPPPALVEQMAKAFRNTEGDLKQVAIAMVSSDEAWRGPPSKLKRPGEWVVGMVRATGITQVDPVRYTGGQDLLGEGLWRPFAPKGYPDDEASWIDGVGRRLDVANYFAERVTGITDPQAIIDNVFASEISPEVKQAVGRAESRQQALALLFMSADFQRR
ncbi:MULTISPECIES: DUF1800 domain-containing protein [unclassified Bradyrhizobium]|uniref:DUF1800 domain-containing protein n=1 Tax=unclassified Bradyrhizobium TaxID=2631580 RepID=UPI00247AFFEB|nr:MULTISPECIES: DUF1800 domain-containing protein [unclassified Bradyrhizobium]WGR69735.1 DUF1800 family protein [Bradyrhizobium sp. ISRA426]WGR81791.1 DUF1800 family protein [Bradyrhizobium sp. ISRA430]WGR84977.1 DUF1800 family protein [Bradyrhizobium sp. ISRA432]